MVVNSQLNEKTLLQSQIEDAYGKVTYSHTTHNKQAAMLIKKNNTIKVFQIILSALTTGSFISVFYANKVAMSIIGTVLSTILLMLNSYSKSFTFAENSKLHQDAAENLWVIREQYLSLLVDFYSLSVEEIRNKRDKLQEQTHQIYEKYPKTDEASYRKAQKALKQEEEQTFHTGEIDTFLPEALRKCSK